MNNRYYCQKCGEFVSELRMMLGLHSCSTNDSSGGVIIRV